MAYGNWSGWESPGQSYFAGHLGLSHYQVNSRYDMGRIYSNGRCIDVIQPMLALPDEPSPNNNHVRQV